LLYKRLQSNKNSTAEMMKKPRMTVAIPIAAILVISVAVSPVIFNNRVQAAANKVIQGSGTGRVTCPNGSVLNRGFDGSPLTISFQGTKGQFPFLGIKAKASGSFDLELSEGIRFFLKKLGDFDQGTITKNAFSFSGTESRDDMCDLALPTTITISGACGQGVAVQFQAANGERGEFTANVVCVI
jgi:hypothetical protein